jgi:hypothetical protein
MVRAQLDPDGASLAHLSRLLEGATGVALLQIGLAPFVSVI